MHMKRCSSIDVKCSNTASQFAKKIKIKKGWMQNVRVEKHTNHITNMKLLGGRPTMVIKFGIIGPANRVTNPIDATKTDRTRCQQQYQDC